MFPTTAAICEKICYSGLFSVLSPLIKTPDGALCFTLVPCESLALFSGDGGMKRKGGGVQAEDDLPVYMRLVPPPCRGIDVEFSHPGERAKGRCFDEGAWERSQEPLRDLG
ncbi:hypothetical protein AOLI_G00081870 [Acnodon oligacanthus]